MILNLCTVYFVHRFDYILSAKERGDNVKEKITIITMNPILGKYVQAMTDNEILAKMYIQQIEQHSSIVSFGQRLLCESSPIQIIDKNSDRDMSLKIIKSKTNDDNYIIASEYDMVSLEEFCWFFLREHWDIVKRLAMLTKFYRPNNRPNNNLSMDISDLSYTICGCMAEKQLDYVIFSKQVDYISRYLFLKEN